MKGDGVHWEKAGGGYQIRTTGYQIRTTSSLMYCQRSVKTVEASSSGTKSGRIFCEHREL